MGITVSALRVNQWLPEWEEVNYDNEQYRDKPEPHFYLFSIRAVDLLAHSDVYRRSTDSGQSRAEDHGTQRFHDRSRSEEIQRFVQHGYPWSALSEGKRLSSASTSLFQPGWLPTAIVVNMLRPGEERQGRTATLHSIIEIEDSQESQLATLRFPDVQDRSEVPAPIEIIDGQHRLLAFENVENENLSRFEVPVVAFCGLALAWRAYLFWTINIQPKKINASLAYDLYPLLREQSWLLEGDAIYVYRESRAQELTEILWSTPQSPWYQRINMLGGPRNAYGPVTQAAFIRSLLASLVKSWRAKGLFGGTVDDQVKGLGWSRAQQGAFLVFSWRALAESIAATNERWAVVLRQDEYNDEDWLDPAFTHHDSLLATDQGVRGFQSIINDMCYFKHKDLELGSWVDPVQSSEVTAATVELLVKDIPDRIKEFVTAIADSLAKYDWRTSNAAELSEQERQRKLGLRGGSGYKELRQQLAKHLVDSGPEDIATIASALLAGRE